jgi:hypothetical protein
MRALAIAFVAQSAGDDPSQLQGDLPETANATGLAAFVTAVCHGIAVQAKAGFSCDVLKAIVEQALSNWPSKPAG